MRAYYRFQRIILLPVAYRGGGLSARAPPTAQNFLIFMQLLEKFGKMV